MLEHGLLVSPAGSLARASPTVPVTGCAVPAAGAAPHS
jgi:hypothetical protein